MSHRYGFILGGGWGASRSLESGLKKSWTTTGNPVFQPPIRTKKRVRSATVARVRRGDPAQVDIPESLYLAEPMRDIDLKPFNFDQLQGKVVYAVNVASEDENTDANYSLMASLYDQFHDHGFEILAFPSNWFGQKETKSNEDIKAFVQEKYGKGIILMDKSDYEENPVFVLGMKHYPGEIYWNFHGKFLFGKDGKPFDRFDLLTTDEHITNRVQSALYA